MYIHYVYMHMHNTHHMCTHIYTHTYYIHKVLRAFLSTNGQGEQWASHSARGIGCLQQANMV